MDLTEALNRRKSVRSYTGELPTREQLDHILEAAYEAPVGMGRYDGIHLTIVTNKDLLARIDATAARFFGNPQAHPLYGAPMLVVISSNADGNVASANVGDILENMSLAAVREGVGSVFIYGATAALAQDADLVAELGLPEGFAPLGSLALGQTDEEYAPRDIPEGHRFAQNVIA